MKSIKKLYTSFGQKLDLCLKAPTQRQAQVGLFALGVVLLSAGLSGNAVAQHVTDYNDERLADSLNAILTYIEGTFGAMVMVAAGIGAILSSAFGQYRAALGLLVVAVGAFILRSLVGTFFNDINIQD